MQASLYYGTEKIDLPEDGEFGRLRHEISEAAGESGWLGLVDAHGDTHHILVTAGVPIRIVEGSGGGAQIW